MRRKSPPQLAREIKRREDVKAHSGRGVTDSEFPAWRESCFSFLPA
jgi:hypothetical protein